MNCAGWLGSISAPNANLIAISQELAADKKISKDLDAKMVAA